MLLAESTQLKIRKAKGGWLAVKVRQIAYLSACKVYFLIVTRLLIVWC